MTKRRGVMKHHAGNSTKHSKGIRFTGLFKIYQNSFYENVLKSHFHPSLIFADKAGAYPKGLHSSGKLLALPTIIKLGVEATELKVTNTLAYYGTELFETGNTN